MNTPVRMRAWEVKNPHRDAETVEDSRGVECQTTICGVADVVRARMAPEHHLWLEGLALSKACERVVVSRRHGSGIRQQIG